MSPEQKLEGDICKTMPGVGVGVSVTDSVGVQLGVSVEAEVGVGVKAPRALMVRVSSPG